MSDWTSTTTAPELAAWLEGTASCGGRVVVLTHTKPDGDAVGSSMALAHALRARGAAVQVWYAGPLPSWTRRFSKGVELVQLDDRPDLPEDFEPDAVCVVDTGTWSQLEAVQGWLAERHDLACVIDHHLHGDADVAPKRLIVTDAAAACEPVGDVACALLGLGSLVEAPRVIADALFLGLATDTGWFRHSNVTPRTMRLAADLIEAGVPHNAMFQRVNLQDPAPRLKLLGIGLSGMDLHDDQTVALMALSRADMTRVGAGPGDTGGFADQMLSIGTVKVAVVLSEAEATGGGVLTKVSMRSKEDDAPVDVNAVARTLGGGGHARAAGARVKAGLDETAQRVLEALR